MRLGVLPTICIDGAGGKERLDRLALSIRTVAECAGKVKELADSVYSGNKEQTGGMDQIAKAIMQMDQFTRKSASSAEESASAAEELNGQAEQLRSVIGRLGALVG